MNESLLDIVFEEDEVVFRNILGYRVGERRKTTDIWGRDRHVTYHDEFGKVISSAREIRPLFGGRPYVEFYDKDKRPRGRAYVTEEILSGRRKVEYTNNEGKTISARYVNEDKVLRNNAISLETSAKSDTAPVSAEFNVSTPMLLCFVTFLGLGLNALFAFLHARTDAIIRCGNAISVYGVCPLMVVLFLLLCRTGKSTGGLRLFRLLHLVVYGAGFAFLAWMTNCLYENRDIALFSQTTNTALAGIGSFLICFAPTLVLGIFSGVWTLLGKKQSTYPQRKAISRSAMNLMKIGNLVLIASAMTVTVFCDAYGSGGISGLISTVVLLAFLALLICLSLAIACLPYKLLSGKF